MSDSGHRAAFPRAVDEAGEWRPAMPDELEMALTVPWDVVSRCDLPETQSQRTRVGYAMRQPVRAARVGRHHDPAFTPGCVTAGFRGVSRRPMLARQLLEPGSGE